MGNSYRVAGHRIGVILAVVSFFLMPCRAAMAGDGEDQKLVAEMRAFFAKYPQKFSDEIQRSFFAKRVAIGMDPYLAHLAAGAFAYRVDADPLKWPKYAEPQQVMWAQAMHPDNSKIWMTFENTTQFPGEGLRKFVVYIENGRVKTIEKI